VAVAAIVATVPTRARARADATSGVPDADSPTLHYGRRVRRGAPRSLTVGADADKARMVLRLGGPSTSAVRACGAVRTRLFPSQVTGGAVFGPL
jgi:hypothetical protein